MILLLVNVLPEPMLYHCQFDDIFKCIALKMYLDVDKIYLEFVPNDNGSTLYQIMAWCQTDGKPFINCTNDNLIYKL